jgi:hypothetical protein
MKVYSLKYNASLSITIEVLNEPKRTLDVNIFILKPKYEYSTWLVVRSFIVI